MMYRVKEEYRKYRMFGGFKASAINLDVDKPIKVLHGCEDEAGGSHCIEYHDKDGGVIMGFMDIDMLEEWK